MTDTTASPDDAAGVTIGDLVQVVAELRSYDVSGIIDVETDFVFRVTDVGEGHVLAVRPGAPDGPEYELLTDWYEPVPDVTVTISDAGEHDFSPRLGDYVELRGQVVEVSDLHCEEGQLLVTVRVNRADAFNEDLGPEWFAVPVLAAAAGRPAPEMARPECGAACPVYFCPTSGEQECPSHGGFDVCCERPDLHRPAPDKSGTARHHEVYTRESEVRFGTDADHAPGESE